MGLISEGGCEIDEWLRLHFTLKALRDTAEQIKQIIS